VFSSPKKWGEAESADGGFRAGLDQFETKLPGEVQDKLGGKVGYKVRG